MANMIIKPAVGGNLLIQDRAGGAVLSTGTSGAAIASGVTGGAGLSGMTSLGTVTAGNLSNSAIVYPAGHVINTWSYDKIYTGNMIISIAETWHNVDYGGSYGTMNVTGVTATEGNKLFIACQPGTLRTNSDGTFVTDVGLKIDTTSISCIGAFYNATYIKANGSFNMVYTVPASFTNKTIGLWAGRQSGAAGTALFENTNHVNSGNAITLLVQEIQQ